MIFDLQKASLLKRISAYILDLILLAILVTGLAWGLGALLQYDACSARMDSYYTAYEASYGIDFDISEQDFLALSPEEQAKYEAANQAMNQDEDVLYTYNLLINLTLVILTLSILLAYLILELIVPLKLKNGQTIGKKIFGVALMRTDGVKINTVSLFVRTVLGKFTIETMIPVLIIIMILFNSIGVIGTAILGLIFVIQLVLLFATRTHAQIHDLLANTVAVDLASQMIFESEEAMIEYKKKASAEKAEKQPY